MPHSQSENNLSSPQTTSNFAPLVRFPKTCLVTDGSASSQSRNLENGLFLVCFSLRYHYLASTILADSQWPSFLSVAPREILLRPTLLKRFRRVIFFLSAINALFLPASLEGARSGASQTGLCSPLFPERMLVMSKIAFNL